MASATKSCSSATSLVATVPSLLSRMGDLPLAALLLSCSGFLPPAAAVQTLSRALPELISLPALEQSAPGPGKTLACARGWAACRARGEGHTRTTLTPGQGRKTPNSDRLLQTCRNTTQCSVWEQQEEFEEQGCDVWHHQTDSAQSAVCCSHSLVPSEKE